jgi:hypothetical protein
MASFVWRHHTIQAMAAKLSDAPVTRAAYRGTDGGAASAAVGGAADADDDDDDVVPGEESEAICSAYDEMDVAA